MLKNMFQSFAHFWLLSRQRISTTQDHSQNVSKSRPNTQNGQLRILQRKGMARSTVSQSLCWYDSLHVSFIALLFPSTDFSKLYLNTEPTGTTWVRNYNRWPRNCNAQQTSWWKKKTIRSGFSTKSMAEWKLTTIRLPTKSFTLMDTMVLPTAWIAMVVALMAAPM